MDEKDYTDTFDLDDYERECWECRAQFNEIPMPNNDIDYRFTNEDVDFYHEQVAEPTPEERALLKEAIETLTEKQRNILDLHLKGWKQVDIADKLGIAQCTVSVTLKGCKNHKSRVRHGGVLAKLKYVILGKKCERCGDDIEGKKQSARLCFKCLVRYTKKPRKEGKCPVCGESFTGQANKRYCSSKCYRRASYLRRKKENEIKECGVCGAEYTTSNGRKYCSIKCRQRSAYLRNRKKNSE